MTIQTGFHKVVVACVADETEPQVKSVCEAVPKSLFWTPNCVPGFELAP